jgi:hypothetical protein
MPALCPLSGGKRTSVSDCPAVAVSRSVDGAGKYSTSEARLRHDVVFLGYAKRHLAKKILRPSHIGWILDGPKAGGSVTETMEIDSKSEGFLGTPTDGVINGHGAHWTSLVGRPDAGVSFGAGDATAEALQI